MSLPGRADRAAGAVVGWAVGDALGAPFEFRLGGTFSGRFPEPGGLHGNELCGGGGWKPGEATDDTQMGLLVAESLLECGGLDLPDIFRRFRRWAAADPKDIGILTETVLTGHLPWDQAALDYAAHNLHAAGNGSLMRAVPAALRYSRQDQAIRVEALRRIGEDGVRPLLDSSISDGTVSEQDMKDLVDWIIRILISYSAVPGHGGRQPDEVRRQLTAWFLPAFENVLGRQRAKRYETLNS